MALISTTMSRYLSTILSPSFSVPVQQAAAFSSDKMKNGFGLLFDIDGVLLRGTKPIPAAKRALKRLTDKDGNFIVPTVFVTNAGNALCQTKAEALSKQLDMKISSDQVMLSHSPLRMFQEYHDKCVLLSGQGPVEQIARRIGFTNCITIDNIRAAFPNLDMVDHKRRPVECSRMTLENFPKIEAVILFGEPVRWETNLQLIIDVLLTNGSLNDPITGYSQQKVPVLACNLDLQWMAESHMPRFGHGMFLHCLEAVYEKLAGRPLSYSALMGKPTEITYYYAEQLIMREASKIGLRVPVKTLYAIGDNPMADIYGANLYNRTLKNNLKGLATPQRKVVTAQTAEGDCVGRATSSERPGDAAAAAADSSVTQHNSAVETCHSVLVCTGVYSSTPGGSTYQKPPVFHGPRDMKFDVELCGPDFITDDANAAVDMIFKREHFTPLSS